MTELRRFIWILCGSAVDRRLLMLLLGLTVCGSLNLWQSRLCAASEIVLTDLGDDFRPMDVDDQARITGRRLSTGEAAIWDGSTFVDLGTLGGATSVGNAIHHGQVVGTSSKIYRNGAFHYAGSMTELETPFFSANVTGVDINAAGQKLGNVVGGGFKLIGLWDGSNNFGTALGLSNATGFAINDMTDGVGERAGAGVYWEGSNTAVAVRTFPTFIPSGGINNQRLIGGVINSSTAALVQIDVPGNPTAIPNIALLGSSSAVTGLNNSNELVGNTNSTVFYYNYDTGGARRPERGDLLRRCIRSIVRRAGNQRQRANCRHGVGWRCRPWLRRRVDDLAEGRLRR